MSNLTISVIVSFLLVCCAPKAGPKKKVGVLPSDSSSYSSKDNSINADPAFDSTIVLFGDSSLLVHYHYFKTLDEQSPNAVLTFTKEVNGVPTIAFVDSLYCLHPDIDLADFNNDRTKDLLVFHYTGGRANPTYYLYLVDNKEKRLTRIRGFEELPNPYLDSLNNIIVSIGLSGTNAYRFHRINSKHKLIDLGHGFEDDYSDTSKYEKAIKAILSDKKKQRTT